MKKARTELMFYVLLASCILFIAASIWSNRRERQYPVISHGSDKTIIIREPIINSE